MGHWTFICAALLSAVGACGGRAAVNHGGPMGAAGTESPMGDASVGSAASGAGGSGGDTGIGGGRAGPCTGSLETVSKTTGFACPATLCDATAWAIASCSLWSSVSAAAEQVCTGLRAFTLTLADGETQTCIYAPNITPSNNGLPGPMLDGALVGALVTASDKRFCVGTADAISAGQQLPAGCGESPLGKVCARAPSSSDGGTPSGDDAGAPAACPDAFSRSCAPCCAAVKPDCTDKPDGYPGYSCTPAPSSQGASYCSCSCSGGQWACGC